jgi:hypothetical protein
VQEEAAAIPQAYAIIAQMEHQNRHLEHISNHLPSRLPGAPPPGKENALHVPLDAVKTPAAAAAPPADEGAGAEEQATAGRPVTARKKKAAEPAPRHYITVRSPLALLPPHPRSSLAFSLCGAAAAAGHGAQLGQQLHARQDNSGQGTPGRAGHPRCSESTSCLQTGAVIDHHAAYDASMHHRPFEGRATLSVGAGVGITHT